MSLLFQDLPRELLQSLIHGGDAGGHWGGAGGDGDDDAEKVAACFLVGHGLPFPGALQDHLIGIVRFELRDVHFQQCGVVEGGEIFDWLDVC